MQAVQYKVESSEGRIDLFLSRVSGQSRMFVKSQIEAGHVLLNGVPVSKGASKLTSGDEVTAQFEEETRLDLTPVKGPLDILYEDTDIIVLNKSQGVVVHPAAGHRGETLVHYLLHHLQTAPDFVETSPVRPGIVHRLDVGTSGVIVIAKNRLALENLSAQFKERTVAKEYEALAWGKMTRTSGLFNSAIGRHPTDRKRMSSKSTLLRPAETRYEVIRQFAHFIHVRLSPKTGRTHQLRVHLSENKNSIVGDGMYGGQTTHGRLVAFPAELRKPLADCDHPCLHARSLKLDHPVTKQRMAFEAPRPKKWDDLLKLLDKLDP